MKFILRWLMMISMPCGSITFEEGSGDTTDNVETIIKVCNRLCKDGILSSGHSFRRNKAHYTITGDKITFYLSYNFVHDLSDEDRKEVTKLLVAQLNAYCFKAFASGDESITFTFNRESQLDKKSKLIDKSLSKVLSH